MAQTSNLLEVPSLQRIRAGYSVLEGRILQALNLHLGDPPRLQQNRHLVLEFRNSMESHRNVFETQEWSTITDNLTQMLEDLDQAEHTSRDPPENEPIRPLSVDRSSGCGRPRLSIDPDILETAMELASLSEIGRQFGCSARTVKRRAQELGLVVSSALPSTTTILDNATDILNPTPSYQPHNTRMSNLTNEEVDTILHDILIDFPSLGRQMIMGMFRVYGLRVSRETIRDSYNRVIGLPPGFGAPRRIQRRVYNVAGPGALTHMDGWHGLIKFGIVVHMFIDGYSRYITGLGVHDNNRAHTVLLLFEKAISETGLPSRIRGDHGGENIEVARKMEADRGSGRNSFIWGRSVHNIRCERTWYDLNQVFGLKWKNFLLQLEVFEGLIPSNAGHRWLLHHLFLQDIREDAEIFRQGWNKHIMQLDTRNYSPEAMFFFGMINRGPRGLDRDYPIDNPEEYGADWEALEDERSTTSYLENSNDSEIDERLEADLMPNNLNIVEAPTHGCPLSDIDVAALDETLERNMGLNYINRSMDIRRQKWRLGLTMFYEGVALQADVAD